MGKLIVLMLLVLVFATGCTVTGSKYDGVTTPGTLTMSRDGVSVTTPMLEGLFEAPVEENMHIAFYQVVIDKVAIVPVLAWVLIPVLIGL